MKKIFFVIIILALLSLAAVPFSPTLQEECYPFEKGRVCLDSQNTLTPTETATATDISTITPTLTSTSTNTPTLTVTPTSTVTATPILTSTPLKIIWQDNFDFFRNPQIPFNGSINSQEWAWPAGALSASTIPFYTTLMKNVKVKYARWVLIWNPSTGDIPTKVRLVVTDSGPSNIQEIAVISQTNYNNPMGSSVNVTSALQSLLDNPTNTKFIGEQTLGNGSNGALVYGSWIEVIWETK